MRLLFGCLAVVLGAFSIALAARYGFKTADTTIDAVISASVFGAIALCAFLFDAAAVRLWFMGHRIGSVIIGLIATAALVVTFSNSLGTIAGRGDVFLAKRQNITDTRADNRRELERLEAALAALAAFTPADGAAVLTAKRAADAATASRQAECDKRGPLCKQWERDEAAAATRLADVTAAKAQTDRTTKLEAEIAAVRAKLSGSDKEAVSEANPLGKALANIIGGAAATLTSWQQAIVAAVFELCLVGVMVIYELLGQRTRPLATQLATVSVLRPTEPLRAASVPVGPALPPPRNSRPRRARGARESSPKAFLSKHLFPAGDGERVDMKSLLQMYRAWCADNGFAPVDLDQFLDEIEQLGSKLGLRIEPGDDKRVYCHGVRIATTEPAKIH
jgi:hypothetical protein